MKKYVLFALVALFFVSSHSAWADTAFVKVTAEDGTVSWIPIAGIINSTIIEISKINGYDEWDSAIDQNTKGSIDLNEVWSRSGGRGTHYQVTSIGEMAFFNCSGLISINIPSSVKAIGKSAFRECCSLTSVVIPSSVISIENYTFYGCEGLTSVVIPSSVTSIGRQAFDGCSFTTIVIPSSVTSIGAGAFSCTGLTSITIPPNVTSIEDVMFYECINLTSIEIPSSVTSIRDLAFEGCSGLTSIEIPNSVNSIGDEAFAGCSGLTSIEIPNSVNSIGERAFMECSGLTSIVVVSGNPVYDSRNNCNAIIETASNTLIVGCKNTKITSSVTSIGNHAFEGCRGLTSITIPNGVTSIEDYAFIGCKGLTSITSCIKDVFETGYYAFKGCENATLYVPRGTKSQYQSTADWYRINNIVEMSNPYDVNNDGSTDISDVVSLVNFILDSSTTDNSYDVNGDGSVDISDVVYLVNMILGQ